MHYRKHKTYLYIITFLLLFCSLTQNISYAKAEENSSGSTHPEVTVKDTVTITQNGVQTEYDMEPMVINYENNIYRESISPVIINDVWMIPSKIILKKILNCYYEYSSANNTVLMKSPGRDTTVEFTLDSNIAMVNGTAVTMPQEMLAVTNHTLDVTDYLIPMEFAFEQIACSYIFQDTTAESYETNTVLFIYSKYLYHLETDDISFDTEKYENALQGISVKESTNSTKNYVFGTTMLPIKEKNITFLQDTLNYSVTIQFSKTYNPFGNISYEVKNGIIDKIEVLETDDATSSITIYYDKSHVYSSLILNTGGKITISAGDFSLKVLLPDTVKFKNIKTTDQYWNYKFVITIPGNHVDFYKKYLPVINSADIKKTTVKTTDDGNTTITVSTKGLKGYRLTKTSGAFTVKVGEPKDIYDHIVLLDAGHGGKDSGAVRGSKLIEKQLNLTVLYQYAKEYFESSNSSIKAYWTRHDDTFINLYKRPTLSTKYQADLFVSLHMNSAGSHSANGIETYYSKDNNSKSFSGITSKKFAKVMQSTLVDSLGSKDRGVKQAAFIVAKNNTVPAILIELGFITGNTDSKKLKKASYQKKAAKSIYQGIEKTFEKYATIR